MDIIERLLAISHYGSRWVLWLLIAATIIAFWRIQVLAALLLVPYLAWVSFAAMLNWTLWKANPGLLAAAALP